MLLKIQQACVLKVLKVDHSVNWCLDFRPLLQHWKKQQGIYKSAEISLNLVAEEKADRMKPMTWNMIQDPMLNIVRLHIKYSQCILGPFEYEFGRDDRIL